MSIPKGIADNDIIRLKGQGGPGYGQGPNGELYLHIKFIAHPLFDVEEHNLMLSIPISPWEAALGSSVTVPTLSGQVKVNIKPNSQTGQKLRLKGKGIAGKSTAGDLIGVIKMTDSRFTICFEELCKLENVDIEWMIDIVDYGIAKPISGSNKTDWYFDNTSVIWLKKAVRIYHELEIDWVAVAMIIDLLKQKQTLMEGNQALQNRLHRFHNH